MKHIKLGMVLCALVAFLPMSLWAQTPSKFNLKAVILAENGEPVDGAVITSVEDEEEVVSDGSGSFTISVTPNSTLSVSADGYATKIEKATPGLQEILLVPVSDEEIVHVAYRSVGESDLSGGVSYVNVPELLEKNYFTYPFDNMEAFVPGLSSNIWGMDDMLILVDGVPRDLGS